MADEAWSLGSDRFHGDSCGFEAGANFRGEVVRARRVAVHADGVGVEGDHGAVDRHHGSLFHHAHRARDHDVGIVDDRAGLAP